MTASARGASCRRNELASLVLALVAVVGCTTAREPPVTPPETATPTPAAPTRPPAPTPVPTSPPPAALPTTDLDPPLVRVLLARSASGVRFPQPGRAYWATWYDGARWLWGPLEVGAAPRRLWQVGAWEDPTSASAAAARLTAVLGEEAVVDRQEASDGLWRVWVDWPSHEPEDPVAVLGGLGFEGAFAVPDGAAVVVTASGGGPLETTGEVQLEPAGEWPTEVGSRRFRGRFRVRASAGEVLVVNDLNLESYLKGVVPVEMGPSAFPELEALKAQAVAARTYAVAHFWDHDDEGYDLCATPACQAYYGVGAEHRLSDRAVEESAGLVAVFDGQPIDAMYTSTCGGHTEDAAPLFPDRDQIYLRGVPCAWERPLELLGSQEDGPWQQEAAMERELAGRVLLLAGQEPTPQRVLDRVAVLCGTAPVTVRLDADVDAFAAALEAASGLQEAVAVVARNGSPAQRLLELTDLFDRPLAPPPASWRRGWHLRAALAALELQGVVVRDRGEAVPRPDGAGIYPRRASASETLPSPVRLFERWGDAVRPVARAEVLPGTALERVRHADTVLAVLVQRSGGDGEADRRSAWRSWARERTWEEVAARLEVADLESLEVTARAPRSGRVVGLAAVGSSGERREWDGFGVRRALDLPENLFSFHRRRRLDGTEVVRFLGRGWGHGVGMCQNGAYGLARSGRRFEEILATYYTGVRVERMDALNVER